MHFKFDFISQAILPEYNCSSGYGFSSSSGPSKDEDKRESFPGDYNVPAMNSFLVDVPNGNYTVTVALGDSTAGSVTTVKAGLGRLMLEAIKTASGQSVIESFSVHVDDGQLKLAFLGSSPRISRLEIQDAPAIPTLFLAGDSTMTDQPSGQFPYAGWGQMLSRFFNSSIAVSNRARSGRSTKSFIQEGRLDQIWNWIRPGDYLLVQFAHNDEKNNAGGTEPFTTYQQYLKIYLDGARQRGAIPLLATPVHRRFFDADGKIQNTHGEYSEAMKQLAVEETVSIIDLANLSKLFFEKVGEEGTKQIFMWTEPHDFASFADGTRDNTHFQEQGGIAIARLFANAISEHPNHPLYPFLRS
ncbi:MAG: hypothetical protein JWN30_1247 [Bacilli bacterium]|nr:hypothetical protein [Bacilli bacterium]